MKSPKLGSMVLFAVLTNEPAQSFVAATGGPVGEAVIQPTPYPGGLRAATVVGFAGKPDSGRVALVIYKQPGDPYRGDSDATVQRLGDVPHSDKGIPGTWLTEAEADALQAAAGITAEALAAMNKETLFAHAKEHGIDLGGVTTKTDALPLVAKHHKLTLPA